MHFYSQVRNVLACVNLLKFVDLGHWLQTEFRAEGVKYYSLHCIVEICPFMSIKRILFIVISFRSGINHCEFTRLDK